MRVFVLQLSQAPNANPKLRSYTNGPTYRSFTRSMRTQHIPDPFRAWKTHTRPQKAHARTVGNQTGRERVHGRLEEAYSVAKIPHLSGQGMNIFAREIVTAGHGMDLSCSVPGYEGLPDKKISSLIRQEAHR